MLKHGVCELLWIWWILHDLGLFHPKPMMLHCDNKVAIAIVNYAVLHDWAKHMEIDRHFIKDHLNQGTINLSFINTQTQLADMLTKVVFEKVFHSSLYKLGMLNIYSLTWGRVLKWAKYGKIYGINMFRL